MIHRDLASFVKVHFVDQQNCATVILIIWVDCDHPTCVEVLVWTVWKSIRWNSRSGTVSCSVCCCSCDRRSACRSSMTSSSSARGSTTTRRSSSSACRLCRCPRVSSCWPLVGIWFFLLSGLPELLRVGLRVRLMSDVAKSKAGVGQEQCSNVERVMYQEPCTRAWEDSNFSGSLFGWSEEKKKIELKINRLAFT